MPIPPFIHIPHPLRFPHDRTATKANQAPFSSHRKGFILQLAAAGYHHKSDAQIARLAAQIGPQRILLIHGTRDNMVTFPHGEELLRALGGEEAGITKRFVDGQGHVIPIEMRDEFRGWVEELVQRTEGMRGVESVQNGVVIGDGGVISVEGKADSYLVR
jgi:hypothetical protein